MEKGGDMAYSVIIDGRHEYIIPESRHKVLFALCDSLCTESRDICIKCGHPTSGKCYKCIEEEWYINAPTTKYIADLRDMEEITDTGIRETLNNLDMNETPPEGGYIVIDPDQMEELIYLFSDPPYRLAISDDASKTGHVAGIYGMKVYMKNKGTQPNVDPAILSLGRIHV